MGRFFEVSPFQGFKEGNLMAALHFVQGHQWFSSSGAT